LTGQWSERKWVPGTSQATPRKSLGIIPGTIPLEPKNHSLAST
jgi:hypothetical protein